MSDIGNRLRQARLKADVTQVVLSDICGVSRAAVALWETGKANPTLKNLLIVADFLRVPVGWLAGEKGSDPRKRKTTPRITRPIPLITPKSAAVRKGEAARQGKGVVSILHTDTMVSNKSFALKIEDRSMEPELRVGDIVFIDPDVPPFPGDFVVAQLPGIDEAVIRKYRPQATLPTEYPDVELVPLNADWPDIMLNVDNPGCVIGPVVELRRPRENCRSQQPTTRQSATDAATPAKLIRPI